ncbi:hypothetical protein ACPCG0_12190 [Propionibacteriaceae bacterium Y1923]
MVADPDAGRVYLCEDRLQRWARAGTAVLVDGRLVSVEAEHDFADLAAAALFCTLTCLELGLPPVRVRQRRGERQSHYQPARGADPAEIALASWGAARLVVLHELAHHLAHHTPGGVEQPAHGPVFRAALVRLLRHVDLPRQAAELQRLFDQPDQEVTP